jgi:type VII secretion-associated serine protease mycosin
MGTIRRGLAATASLALAALTVLPAVPAAAALPKPRNEEWWFSAWGVEQMAWPQSTGQGVTVAVVDTGVNADLPELRGVVLPGTDVTGHHPGDGRKDTDEGSAGFSGHGTAMAALIAGQGGGAGMVGVAPNAKILPIVVDGFTMAKAIRYAADHGAQVISISEVIPATAKNPCGYTSELQDAIAYAIDKNSVVVAGAGNDGQARNGVMSPASCAGVLAVGAVDNKKQAWPKTERQSYVAVAAPGWGVGSIDKQGRFVNGISGTSQATALTSAAIALVRAKHPELTPREVVQRVINTAVDAGPAGHDEQTGSGVVLPPDALTKDVGKSAPNPPFERLDKWLATQGKSASTGASAQATQSSGAAKSSSGSNTLIFVVIGVVVVVGVGLVVFLLVRRRKPTPPAQYPPANQYSGPPPSFGPGPGGPPPQQRPSFLPPPDQPR